MRLLEASRPSFNMNVPWKGTERVGNLTIGIFPFSPRFNHRHFPAAQVLHGALSLKGGSYPRGVLHECPQNCVSFVHSRRGTNRNPMNALIQNGVFRKLQRS